MAYGLWGVQAEASGECGVQYEVHVVAEKQNNMAQKDGAGGAQRRAGCQDQLAGF